MHSFEYFMRFLVLSAFLNSAKYLFPYGINEGLLEGCCTSDYLVIAIQHSDGNISNEGEYLQFRYHRYGNVLVGKRIAWLNHAISLSIFSE